MSSKRPRWWLRIVVAVLLFLGLLAAAGAAFILPRQRAVDCLVAFSSADPGEDGVLLAGQTLVTEEAKFGFGRVIVQRPAMDGPRPVLVFVHGVAAQGLDDGRILQAVDAFARGGFVVVAPEVPLLVRPPHADDDEERLVRLLDAVAAGDIEGTKPERIGMIGVSVGGALALRAAATWCERGGRGLRAVLAIGSPDDLETLSQTWFSMAPKDAGPAKDFEAQRRKDAQFARGVIFRAALGRRIADPDDRDRLRTWLEADEGAARVAPDGLTSDAARQYAKLITGGRERWQTERASVLADAWPLMQAFSPAQAEARLASLAGVTCFLLHGTGDSLVPQDEFRRLETRLAKHTICVGLLSRMIGHVEVESVGLGERIEHVVFMDDFFDAVGN